MRSSSDFTTPALLFGHWTVHVPGVVHHQGEVSVIINAHGYIIVVFSPFLFVDNSISGVWVALDVIKVIFKSVKELSKNLILCLLAGFNIWMLLGIVGSSDIIDVNITRTILIQNIEGLHCNLLSGWVHFTSNHSKEFIIGDFSTSISIEKGEDFWNLSCVHTNSEVVHAFLELFSVKWHGSVVISNLEFSCNGRNTSGSSLGKSFSQVIKKLLFISILRNGFCLLSIHWLFYVENVAGHLSSGSGVHWSSTSFFSSCACIILTGPSLFAISLSGSFGKFPCVLHHELEVVIIINRSGDVVVVFFELFLGDNVIWSFIVSHGMSCFEGLKELLEDLVFGFLSRKNIWVFSSIVNTSDIIEVDPTIAVFVELIECLSNKLLSGVVHWSSDGSNELIKFNETTSVEIEVWEKFLDFSFSESEHVVSHGFGEFIFIKRSGVVVIHDLELSLETNETSRTSWHKLGFQSFSKLFWWSVRFVLSWRLWSGIQGITEFFIWKSTTFILIIDVE